MKSKLLIAFTSLAVLSGIAFLVLSALVGGHAVAYGATPTSGGISSIVVSLLSTSGFTVAGVLTWVIQRFWPAATTTQVDNVGELVASFEALMGKRNDRAAQRRFMFAMVDAASLIQGCQTSHENGVIDIKYTGYADPAPVVKTT